MNETEKKSKNYFLGKIEEIALLSKQFTDGASISAITTTINRLRVLIMVERFNKAICGLQVKPVKESLVLTNIAKQKGLSKERKVFQFNREEHYYLVLFLILKKI